MNPRNCFIPADADVPKTLFWDKVSHFLQVERTELRDVNGTLDNISSANSSGRLNIVAIFSKFQQTARNERIPWERLWVFTIQWDKENIKHKASKSKHASQVRKERKFNTHMMMIPETYTMQVKTKANPNTQFRFIVNRCMH